MTLFCYILSSKEKVLIDDSSDALQEGWNSRLWRGGFTADSMMVFEEEV